MSLLWSRKKAEAARARWPSDLQSLRWRTASASHSSRRIHRARYRNGQSGAASPIRASIGSVIPPNSSGRYHASRLRGSGSRSSIPPPRTTRWLCTPSRGCRLSEAATSLNSLGVLALPYVGQRNDHQDALGAGLGVTEFAEGGRASEEICELWRWVLNKLVEGSFDHEQHATKAAG